MRLVTNLAVGVLGEPGCFGCGVDCGRVERNEQQHQDSGEGLHVNAFR